MSHVASPPLGPFEAGLSVGAMSSTVSRSFVDDQWDSFLQTTPLGQFQQSSAWARVKSQDGWSPLRVTFTLGSQMVGGFQILSRKSKIGRIGYISKGPVLLPSFSDAAPLVLESLSKSVRQTGISVLIVHAPDESLDFPSLLQHAPFQRNRLQRINQATLRVRVSKGIAGIEKGMSKYTRKKVRHARRQGVAVRECAENDLPVFFDLMRATCQRQGVHPNPSSLEGVRAIWNAFSPTKQIRLTIAETQGEPVAALLALKFGQIVTLWKKGWSGEHSNLHPNEVLAGEALDWASLQGFEYCDFAGLDTQIAATLIKGEPLSEAQMKSRDFFNIGFGGEPKLLPEPRVLIPNPLLRKLYGVCGPLFQSLRSAFP